MKKILITDDSLTARSILKKCLKIVGLDEAIILEAENGMAALSILENHDIDLIFTDLNMPQMGGEELIKCLKSKPDIADIPIVVIASAGNKAKEMELVRQGATSVISKPISPLRIRIAMKETSLWSLGLHNFFTTEA